MRYRCSHCNHTFELEEREFHRCPNCFWTTSLEAEGEMPSTPRQEHVPPSGPKERIPKSFPWKPVLGALVFIAIFVSIFILIRSGKQIQVPLPQFKLPQLNLKSPSPKQKPAKAPEAILTKEELVELERPFQLTIPRKLTDDEEAILKKQVSLPASLSEKPKITQWSKKDFDELVASEQKKRKIVLGWWYVRSTAETFEKNYPAGVKAFESENYVLARELFIKSLTFPVYRGDVKRYRAVVLVMLRPYINDVIGKIAIINQHLAAQALSQEAQGIFDSYQVLFPVLELQEWDKAFQMIADLKKRMETFESRPQDVQVNYPAAFGKIDPELKLAIQNEASPKPEAAFNLKPLTVDLNLKERVVRQNTPAELTKVQKQYEQALQMVKEKNWDRARDGLRSVEFPEELAEDARKKLALIEKFLAAQNAGKE